MRLTNIEVEHLLGCTPCLCGDIETWHSRCYVGKSQAEVDEGYKRAFRIARVKLKTRLAQQAAATINKAEGTT